MLLSDATDGARSCACDREKARGLETLATLHYDPAQTTCKDTTQALDPFQSARRAGLTSSGRLFTWSQPLNQALSPAPSPVSSLRTTPVVDLTPKPRPRLFN
jgi:hypothetical protein